MSHEKEITTLGRGGSDTSAVAIAAALNAEYCEILTDVDGLFDADPRVVPKARLLPECTYDEALELAHLGAKMHPRSIEVAKNYGVTVYIRPSNDPAAPGTVIRKTEGGTMERSLISGIASKDGLTLIKAQIDLDRLLETLSARRIPLRLFTHDPGCTRFVCERDTAPGIIELLECMGVIVELVPKVVAVSAVGEGLCGSSEILPKFLSILRETEAECFLLASQSMSVTAVIPAAAKERVAVRLHEAFLVAPV